MKGFLDIEFAVSVFIFLIAISFVSITIISNIPALRQEAAREDLRSTGWQVSEILFFDEGEPDSWDTVDLNDPQYTEKVRRIGLSSGEKYELHESKIRTLDDLCGLNYNTVRDMVLGSDSPYALVVNIEIEGETDPFKCKPPAISDIRPQFTITRIGKTDAGSDVTMEVSVL